MSEGEPGVDKTPSKMSYFTEFKKINAHVPNYIRNPGCQEAKPSADVG